jgi:transcriptional regulator with GAF, ATPase, and Fis domain
MAPSGVPSPRSFPLGALLKKLSEERPDRRFLCDVLDHLAEALDCERIFLFRLRARGGFHVLVARSRDREDVLRASERMSHFAVRKMVREGEAIYVPDARLDRRYRPEEALAGKRMAMSILVLPLRHSGEIQGGVYADHRFRPIAPPPGGEEAMDAWTALLVLALSLRDETRAARRLRRTLESLRAGAGAAASGAEDDPAAVEPRPIPDGADRMVEFHGLITANPDLRDVCDAIRTMPMSDLPVLIVGETGTGKGLLARAVHESSARGEKPFVALHAPTVPDTLIETELLGHVKGAFTGADADHDGVFLRADGGTLFLDEVGDMSMELQKKLLRVLEDGQVRALGAKAPRQVDVRLVASTSRDLEARVREGLFRGDLYFRLKGATFEVPPLRERREDVLPLAARFLGLHSAAAGREPPVLSEGARRRLVRHSWPGNVRELENEMRRLVALGLETIEARDLDLAQVHPRDEGRARAGASLRLGETVELAEREAILEALRAARWNKSRAAMSLGVTRKSLYRRMAKYGISGKGHERDA